MRITDFGIGGVAVEYLRTQHPRGTLLAAGWLETSLRGSYTPLYASPQQRAGGPPDPRDDVHALGVIGYQMAVGRLDQAPGIDAAEDLREAGMADAVVALLSRCVAQKAERRPKDAHELFEKLSELLAPAAPVPPTAPRPADVVNLSPGSASGETGPSPGRGGATRAEASRDTVDAAARASKSVGASPPFPPREGGSGGLGQPARAPAASAEIQPAPTRQPVPFRAVAFGRSLTESGGWVSIAGRLPGDIAVRPDTAYRLAFPADGTTDAVVEKLRALKGWENLEAIDLSGCGQVTDAALGHLGALPGLKAVGLADTAVTDSGVCRLLARFPDLEAVGLSGCARLSAAVVPYLARLRKLKAVTLPPRADTADVRRELARRRPGCAVG